MLRRPTFSKIILTSRSCRLAADRCWLHVNRIYTDLDQERIEAHCMCCLAGELEPRHRSLKICCCVWQGSLLSRSAKFTNNYCIERIFADGLTSAIVLIVRDTTQQLHWRNLILLQNKFYKPSDEYFDNTERKKKMLCMKWRGALREEDYNK